MQFLNSDKAKEYFPMMRELDKKVFGTPFLYPQTPEMEARKRHPMSIYSSVLSDDGKQMLGYLSLTVVTERSYQALLAGKTKEEDFEPWDHKDTPLLFLRNLVIRDRRATPYIFRYALRDLQTLCEQNDIYLHRTYTIASHWSTRRALEAYKFTEVGKYQGQYPILLASRDSSPILNSFLKKYE